MTLGSTVETASATSTDWWRSAVVYQLYIRSFSDGNGDGVGDIAGIRAHLGHLRDLGVDAVWINPWYPSPMADAGYDVSDYRAIEPVFGTSEEAAALIAEAHSCGLRVLLDIVPNHTSDQHAWFQAALRGDADARARYLFRPGRGDGPPNDWQSVFGGPAWTQVADGSWYLHLFDPGQPDLDWTNPEVRAEFESILAYWFDRGVDGFRIDVAHGLVKAEGLPDVGPDDEEEVLEPAHRPNHPFWDRDGVHDIYRGWRAVADAYPGGKVFVAEAWVGSSERLVRYLRLDELHTAFNFPYLNAAWNAASLRQVIDDSLETYATIGAPATWVLSNHDVVRHVSRLGRPQVEGRHSLSSLPPSETLDRELGTRRARAAALLMFALPGSAYVYQGDELGLWEVEDLPDEVLQDPTWPRSGHTDRGRDGCRVPIPWSGGAAPFGFSPPDATGQPWLPQPADFAAVTVAAEEGDPDSMLALYRAALALRHSLPELGAGELTWRPAELGVLAFGRGPTFTCMVNLSDAEVALPHGSRVLVTSASLTPTGHLPVDAAAWLEHA
jgi:alpha-glucosidase